MTKDSKQKFPPRVGIERQHKDVLTGKMRWRAIHGPMAHYIIDPVVNDEYLSKEESDALVAEAIRNTMINIGNSLGLFLLSGDLEEITKFQNGLLK